MASIIADFHEGVQGLVSSTMISQEVPIRHLIRGHHGTILFDKNVFGKKQAYEFAFLDELWQAKNWGHEEEASIKRNKIRIELNRLIHFMDCIEI